MTTYVLQNTVTVGTNKIFAGNTVDSAQENVANIRACGGVLLPSSTPGVQAAAAIALSARLRGQNEEECSRIMVAALAGQAQATEGTVLEQFAGASLPAKAVAVHAQVAGGAAVNIGSAFTLPLPRRTVQIVRGAGGGSVDYTLTGTGVGGVPLSEKITLGASATVQGTIAFDTLASIVGSVDAVGTTDFQTGDGFGLGQPFVAGTAPSLSTDGVVEAVAASHAASGTIKPTTVPNGTHAYTVAYQPAAPPS